jgi:mRNA-degrading endonuclease RelE of RelBE toxin-antitoxin system
VRVYTALDDLAKSDEGDIKRLTDFNPPEWRLRVGGIRVRYAYIKKDDVILVLRVRPRGKAYER